MRFVKVVKQSEQSGFEEDINQVLNENERAKLIDIKISSGSTIWQSLLL